MDIDAAHWRLQPCLEPPRWSADVKLVAAPQINRCHSSRRCADAAKEQYQVLFTMAHPGSEAAALFLKLRTRGTLHVHDSDCEAEHAAILCFRAHQSENRFKTLFVFRFCITLLLSCPTGCEVMTGRTCLGELIN
jgi:hypothetical protein